jgi:hypothetical protein
MGDINYLGAVVRILEIPTIQLTRTETPYTKFRVQLSKLRPKRRCNTVLTVFAWGKFAQDIVRYYRINDYVLIEGYLSNRQSPSLQKQNRKEILQVTLFKIFPFFLNSGFCDDYE